jgi:predicted RNA-binding protein with PUA-like domain
MKYWLLKTEPTTYSWEDLKKEKNRTTSWEGIRNYQARNYIRDEMRIGDLAFLYHSVQKPPSIVGIVEIVKNAYPDHFAYETGHKYFDPKSKPDNPTWFMVDIRALHELSEPVSIDELKKIPDFKDLVLLNNTRLSVQPIQKAEWDLIIKMRTIKSL